ncbi:MAG TPA: hypothetical protein DCX37_10270 [Firmicutes bacterium]|nr:hypothetical protein [Bacillota bacterium]HBL49690.1 hypothetical protein [Bacillota bacterium]HCF91457.1 hypothetical protein [Bacillota bacterium]HCM17904.1 hypothetical protein [Bacillota bacterium]HCT36001.1 hypothetical protein [Bacillota bacterium]
MILVSSLGAYLKSCREEKGLSLQKIQEDTKIRLKYLEAIEADRLEILPGEVYIRGFLRTYATAVGLNEDQVIARYEKTLRSHTPETEVTANEPTIITTTNLPGTSEKISVFHSNKRFYIYGFGAMIIFALLIVPLLWRMRSDASTRAVDGAAGEENALVISNDSNSGVNSEHGAAEPGYRSGLKTIALSVHSECWVDVRINGAFFEQRTLQPGEMPQWSGSNVEIILGNAGGVTLFEDGQNKGIPGRESQRLELRFTVDDE